MHAYILGAIRIIISSSHSSIQMELFVGSCFCLNYSSFYYNFLWNVFYK